MGWWGTQVCTLLPNVEAVFFGGGGHLISIHYKLHWKLLKHEAVGTLAAGMQ